MLIQILLISLILAFFNATLLLSFTKWHWLDLYQVYRKKWMPDDCYLCFGFWLAVIEVLIIIPFMPSWYLLIVPFLATPITRKLL